MKRVPYSKSTVNKVVKEKSKFGDVVDGRCPATKLSQFDKLTKYRNYDQLVCSKNNSSLPTENTQLQNVRYICNFGLFAVSWTSVILKKPCGY